MRAVCWEQEAGKLGVAEEEEDEEEEVCSRPGLCFGESQGCACCWDSRSSGLGYSLLGGL